MDHNSQDQVNNAFAGGFFAAVLVGGVVAAFAAVAHQIDKLERKVRKSTDDAEMKELSGEIVKIDRDELRDIRKHDVRNMSTYKLKDAFAHSLRVSQTNAKEAAAERKIAAAIDKATSADDFDGDDDNFGDDD